MAEGADPESKTEEATPRKLEEARKKGDVAKSQDVGQVLALAGAASVILGAGGWFAGSMAEQLLPFIAAPHKMLGMLDSGAGTQVLARALWAMTPFLGAVMLATIIGGAGGHLAQSGLIGGNFPTHKTPMTVVAGPTALTDGQNELQVRFESAEVGGVKLVKTYTLTRGSYDIAVQHEVVNNSGQPVSPQLYVQLVRDGNKTSSETPFYSTFTGPAVYTEAQKYQKIEFADIDKDKADFEKSATNGYVAMVQHYFASAWVLADGLARDNFARKVDNNL